jgi:tyrosine-protein phosphatase YwqE
MGFFRNNNNGLTDFSAIATDLHCHVLPGMDDGAATMSESLKMLTEMARLGFTKIIATPHVVSTLYPNTREQILGQVSHLQEVIEERLKAQGSGQNEGLKAQGAGLKEGDKAQGARIKIEGSGEYHMDDELLGLVHSGEVIPFGKLNYLLVELPWSKPWFSYEEVLREIQAAGYVPIIAHPERYAWLMGNMKLYQKLIDMGMLFQLNLNSLNGLYGFQARMAAHQLIDAEMISFTGSDAHYMGHVNELSKVLQNKHFAKLVHSGRLLNSEL